MKAPCLYKALFGLPCPGCGLSRAYGHVVKGQWRQAFYYHPLWWAVPALAGTIVWAHRERHAALASTLQPSRRPANATQQPSRRPAHATQQPSRRPANATQQPSRRPAHATLAALSGAFLVLYGARLRNWLPMTASIWD